MYARFRVDPSTAYGSGIGGIVNAIAALAVAPAGATVSAPAGTTMWHHLGNEEAGGHTVVSQAIGTSSHSGYIIIEGNTDKNGYKRRYRFGTKTTAVAYSGAFCATVDFMRDNSSSYSLDLSYATGSNSASSFQYWKNYGMQESDCDWHVSITADYVYVWYSVPNGASYQMNFAGFSNLNYVPSALLSTGNAFFPAVALYSGSTTAGWVWGSSTTASYYDFYAHSQMIGDSGNSNAGAFINQSNMYYTRTISNTAYIFNNQPMNLGTGYYSGDPVSYYNTTTHTHTFDENGNKIGSLNPYVYYNPFMGLPYTTVKGIAQYETGRRTSTSYQGGKNYWNSQNDFIFDADGTRWVQQHQPNQFGIRAFRAV